MTHPWAPCARALDRNRGALGREQLSRATATIRTAIGALVQDLEDRTSSVAYGYAQVRFVVGDVRGKGISAVEQAARVIRAFRQATARDTSLPGVAADLSSYLAPFFDDEESVTALLVDASDPTRLTWSAAGTRRRCWSTETAVHSWWRHRLACRLVWETPTTPSPCRGRIGHSLGGHMALWLAPTVEGLGAVINVEGLPFLAGADEPEMTQTQAELAVQPAVARLRAMAPDELGSWFRESTSGMFTQPEDRECVLEEAAPSDINPSLRSSAKG